MTKYTPAVAVKTPPKVEERVAKLHLWKALLLFIIATLTIILIVVAGFTFGIKTGSPNLAQSRMASQQQDVAHLTHSLAGFTMDMYLSLSQANPSGNLFYSPLSIMTALGMTLMGCQDVTRSQLASVLNTQQDNQQLKEAFATIMAKYKESSPEYELRSANMMYVSNKLSMVEQYKADLITHFMATAKTVDFGGQSEVVRQEINMAVEKETNNKIKDLIPSGVLNSLTRLVLVNAVYFKGQWAKKFDASHTTSEPFYVAKGSVANVPMMKQTAKFRYMPRDDLDARVLAMDYKGSNLSMVIVLPNERRGLAAVEQKLKGVDLSELCRQGHETKIEVQIPRFKLEYEDDLVKTLKKLGASDLFTAGVADLSGVGGNPGDLYVSNVLHKAYIEVNEEGAEAAAATGVIMMSRMLARPVPPFIAEHPFMFLLHDRASDVTLFAGRYATPDAGAAKEEL